MPLRTVSKKAKKSTKQRALKSNFHELKHNSATIRHTRSKFGAARAKKQMIAIALNASGLGRRTKRKKK